MAAAAFQSISEVWVTRVCRVIAPGVVPTKTKHFSTLRRLRGSWGEFGGRVKEMRPWLVEVMEVGGRLRRVWASAAATNSRFVDTLQWNVGMFWVCWAVGLAAQQLLNKMRILQQSTFEF